MIRIPVLCATFLALLSCAQEQPLQADLIIENASVIDLDDGSARLADQIVISDGRIVHVGERRNIDGEPQRIDAAGAFAIPGLWDAHVHSVSAADWHFPLMVSHGVTAVRNMHTTEEDPFAKINALRARIASAELTGPLLLANGRIVDGPRASWPGSLSIGSPEEAVEAVARLSDAGADFLKVYDGVAPDVYEALMKEAAAVSMPVDGHMPSRVDPKDAARLGHRTVEHLSGMLQGCSSEQKEIREKFSALAAAEPLPFPQDMIAFFGLVQGQAETWDADECRRTASAYAAGRVAVTPTLVNIRSMTQPQTLVEDPEAMRLVPQSVRNRWDEELAADRIQAMSTTMTPVEAIAPQTMSILEEAGVPILAGTDVGNSFLVPGYHLHTELELMVEAGMTPLNALRSATVVPAEILAPDEMTGRVRPGYRADIVLLTSNPIEDIANTRTIKSIILRGELITIK